MLWQHTGRSSSSPRRSYKIYLTHRWWFSNLNRRNSTVLNVYFHKKCLLARNGRFWEFAVLRPFFNGVNLRWSRYMNIGALRPLLVVLNEPSSRSKRGGPMIASSLEKFAQFAHDSIMRAYKFGQSTILTGWLFTFSHGKIRMRLKWGQNKL